MARIVTDSGRGPILPPGAIDFLHRRLMEAVGFALMAAAALFLTLLLSYTPGDPSLNNATDGPVRNLLGRPGSFVADLAVQALGAASALVALMAATWGWRIAGKHGVSRIGLRLVLAFVGTVCMAAGLGALPTPESWPLATGLGGVIGAFVIEQGAAVAGAAGAAVEPVHVGVVAAFLGFAALIPALGLSAADWRTAGRLPVRTAAAVGDGVRWGRDRLETMGVWQNRIEPTLDDAPRRRRAGEPTGLVEPRSPKARSGRRAKVLRQGTLNLGPDHRFQLPPLDLLAAAPESGGEAALSRGALQQNARMLSTVLEDFGVRGEIVRVRPGPVVTLYELEPAPGTKTSRVIGLSDDIARSMSAVSVRVAVVPGRNVIGIELPNVRREMVHLRELLSSDAFERDPGRLTLCLGKDIAGAPVMVDLSRMPHLLIAGTTGSGKSVGINTMVLSLLYRLTPEECKLILIDPKMLELSVYEGIPHLLTPVVTEAPKAVAALKWTVREMEERYRALSQLGVRNITGYNARLEEARRRGERLTRRVQTGFDDAGKPVFEDQPLSMDPLPLIVVVVDEMADLMLVAGKDIEAAVQRLAQMARAAGIHLIMATQRPSVDVITGTIKANFPNRASFQVTSKIDSRTILGEQGAEQLLGQGDMLYMEGGGRITRVHGPFVSDEEVENVVRYLKAQGTPAYVDEVTEEIADGGLSGGGAMPGDPLYDEAVALVARQGKASTSFIQRHLQIGYNRAARIIETMEAEGVVSPANRVGRREVLIGGV